MARECDGCTLCCSILMVPEFKKPMYKMCEFCDKGCTIYKDRPKSCRDFDCGWLQGDMSEDMKPDKVHFMIEKLKNVPIVLALPEKGYEKTWRTQEIEDELRKTYVDKGISVVALDGMALLAANHSPEYVKRAVYTIAEEMGLLKNGSSKLHN